MNNSRILAIKNVKFSGYYVDMNLNIWEDFQICISVRLINMDDKLPVDSALKKFLLDGT